MVSQHNKKFLLLIHSDVQAINTTEFQRHLLPDVPQKPLDYNRQN